jgi:hypothetical protein
MHIHKIQKKQEEKRGIRGYHGYLQVIRTIIGSQHLAVPTTKSSIQKRFRDLGIWPRRASVRGRPFPSSSLAAPRLPCARRGGERIVKKVRCNEQMQFCTRISWGRTHTAVFRKHFCTLCKIVSQNGRLVDYAAGSRPLPTTSDPGFFSL